MSLKTRTLLGIFIVLIASFFATAQDSCAGRCDSAYDSNYSCQCEASCVNYNDCCSDYDTCVALSSCANRPCYGDNSTYTCQCNSYCQQYNDCCDDVETYCPSSQDSCAGRSCYGDDSAYNCQCNSACEEFGDCCSDKEDYCPSATTLSPLDSCAGRPCTGNDASYNCQCNSYCTNYNDCCADKDDYCSSSTTASTGTCGKISVTNAELETASFDMWTDDVNRASPSDITLNVQSQTTTSATVDASSQPLFSYVNPSLLAENTFVLMQNLQDNYIYMQGQNEVVDSEELQEQSDFLDAFLATSIGDYLYNFLTSKNQIGCVDKAGFKDILQAIWFGLYSRQNGADDTSGFEHSFVGEVKSTKVSGFHNWVQLYNQETLQYANYYGWTTQKSPELMGIHFEWHGYMKAISGFSIGTSPEIELALYTLCHLTRPNSICGVKLRDENGSEVYTNIQTYTWSNSYPSIPYSYVASAYFVT